MARPSTSVYFAFNRDTDGAYVFNDITSYVRSVDINRNKSSELDIIMTGDCQIILDNRSRIFEPEYSSSAYYGQIEPNGVVKVVTAGYTEFYGRITGWSFSYDEKSFDATASIAAVDMMSAIANLEFSVDTDFVLEKSGSRVQSILNSSSVGWLEPYFVSTGSRNMTADTVVAGDNVLDYITQIGDNDTGTFYARRDGLLAYQTSTWSNSAGLSCYRYNLALNSDLYIAPTGTSLSGTGWYDGTRSTTWAQQGTYSYTTTTTGGGYYLAYSETDAAKYLIDTDYNISFYIKCGASPQTLTFIYGMQLNNIALNGQQKVTSVSLSANEIRRINLGVVSTSSTTNGLFITFALASGASTNNAFYVDCLLIEKSYSMGQYFDGRSSYSPPSGQTYTFSFSGTADNSTSIWKTDVIPNVDFSSYITMVDTGTGIKFNDLLVSYDSEQLTNQVTVDSTWLTLPAVSENTVFQAKYGLKPKVVNALVDADYDAQTLADYLLANNLYPEFRAESVSVMLNGLSTTDQNTLLAVDLFSFIRLKFKPGNVGTQTDKYYQVIGVSHAINAEEHRMDLKLVSLTNKVAHADSPISGVLDTSKLA